METSEMIEVEFGFFQPGEVELLDNTTVELPSSWNGGQNKVEKENSSKGDASAKISNTKLIKKVKDINFNDTTTQKIDEYKNSSNGYHADQVSDEPNCKDNVTNNNNEPLAKSEQNVKLARSNKDTNNVLLPKLTNKVENKSSWASLFNSSKPEVQQNSRSIAFTENIQNKSTKHDISKSQGSLSNANNAISSSIIGPEEDEFLRRIADQLYHNETVYKSAALLPRGLTNNSNWCYINATLQALLVCAPFCHLMRSLPSRPTQTNKNVPTSTPILDSFIQLIKDYKPLPKGKLNPKLRETRHGSAHEPKCVYDMLSIIQSNLSKQGKQEDAEEFLSCVLNGIHEEMLMTMKRYQDEFTDNTRTQTDLDPGYEIPCYEEESQNESDLEEGDQWEEVSSTRKNKTSFTRRTDNTRTAVSEIFRGELRSDLHQDGQKGSATLEPFFTLPLDISSDNVYTVTQALEGLGKREMVMDVTNSKTKIKGDAIRRQTLETLPPVLILHLKRFVYDKKGGSMKLDKEIQYHTDLVIGKNLISKTTKKYWSDKRAYKLFAVVYHHGKELTGGHYTADVYHDRLNCWLSIDDQIIRNSNVHEVVRNNPNETPYLLYYKRTDLMAV